MGKNMTTKKKKAKELQRRKTIRLGVLSLLVVLGLGTMVGMAMVQRQCQAPARHEMVCA